MKLTPVRKTAVILFLGLSFCYLALAPGTVEGQGYVPEELASGLRMLEVFNAWVKGHPIRPMIWSRHGPLPVILDLPLLKLGKSIVSPDFVLSLEPLLLTAAMLTVLFLWLRKVCSPGMSLLLTLTGAFGTMLWPYAYIGLETKQSLFVLLAGYLALANGKISGWARILKFAVVCALAMTVKSTGVILWPAIAYLVYVQFRDDWRARRIELLAVALAIGGLWVAGALGRNLYWRPLGGSMKYLNGWWIDSPFQLFTNAIGIFGSPTKGLFIFAPVLLLAVYAIPQAFRRQRDLVIFTLLVTACTVGFLSLLRFPSDEVWGPRYMHLTIAPLLVCIGAAWPVFEWRKHAALLVLATAGVAVSFLGAFFYYGTRGWVTDAAAQNTMEWVTGDIVWSEVIFDARLFAVWSRGGSAPVPWVPTHVWVWAPQADAQTWKPIHLENFSHPQSFLLRKWSAPLQGTERPLFGVFLFSLILGPLLQLWAILRTAKERRSEFRKLLADVDSYAR